MNNNNNNNKKVSDWISWGLIMFLFLIDLWWLALPLLGIKLFAPDTKKSERREAPSLRTVQDVRTTSSRVKPQSAATETVRSLAQSPKNGKTASIVLMVIGGILAFSGIVSLAEPLSMILTGAGARYVVEELLQYLSIAAAGGLMIGGGVRMQRANGRFAQYKKIIGSNEAVHIPSLAKKLGLSERRVKKDLQKMIDQGDFGDAAYINSELNYLFLSSEADREIMQAREAAHEKSLEAQKKEKEQSELDAYESVLHQIRDVNDRIAHEEMSRKIDQLESITREIFRTVKEEPEKRKRIDRFMTYYLPTTLKLLESYARLEKTGVDGENIEQSKASIENAMDNIVAGFKNQLDELYKNDVMSIETELDVMQKMMDRDAPAAKSDFAVAKKTTKEAAKAAPEEDTLTQFEKDFNLTHSGGTKTVSLGGTQAQEK